jgi:hypothetical protein
MFTCLCDKKLVKWRVALRHRLVPKYALSVLVLLPLKAMKMFFLATGLAFLWMPTGFPADLPGSDKAVGVEPVQHFLDEVNNRHLTVTTADFGKVTILIRFVGAGSSSRWFGDGVRKEKEITFSQTVGEDQERGTLFTAKGGESKLEIAYKPDQREPQDHGINGLYRRITEEKRLSLSKKELDSSEEMLALQFKTAAKTWPNENRSTVTEWKAQWPELRSRWMELAYKPADVPAIPGNKAPLGSATKPGGPTAEEKQVGYWIARTETTNMAIGFLSVVPDSLIPPDWNGEYDDGFGGHVSLRVDKDGTLRFVLTCNRGTGEGYSGELAGRVPTSSLLKEKNGEMRANYKHNDPGLRPADEQALVILHKVGHFLTVKTEHAERYRGRAWFEGLYRWSPVPKE